MGTLLNRIYKTIKEFRKIVDLVGYYLYNGRVSNNMLKFSV